MKHTIRIVVIDDSAFMRKYLSIILESDPEIRVVATARDGEEGLEQIERFQPDLVTLDLDMPRMDGLSALQIIMERMPLPVLIISSLSIEGARATLDALSLGAVDFIPKEQSGWTTGMMNTREQLVTKVKHIVRSATVPVQYRSNSGFQIKSEKVPELHFAEGEIQRKHYAAVAIAVSTGGPYALLQMIPRLPRDFPLGIAVVQHMPPYFTHSLAERLDRISGISVKEAEDREPFQTGIVYLAPGGNHLTFTRNGKGIYVRISSDPTNTLYRPSADLMMNSAVEVMRAPLIGVIMTGMGRDGVEGLRRLRKNQGFTIAQNKESCVVYGMPKEAIEEGVVDRVMPLQDIPGSLIQLSTDAPTRIPFRQSEV